MGGPDRSPTRTYRALRALARTALALYYREVEVHGREHVPAEGPLLILANHHNGMVDPMLLVATSRRQVRFLAKAPLWKIPVLSWIVRGVRAVPVHRPQDPGYEPGMNAGVYAAVGEVLAVGGAVGIFPEGRSHTDPWVAEFKHGASRMALEAEAAHGFELGLHVQLVGIQFERSRLFRGKALVSWAEPLDVLHHREAYGRDPRQAVEALTEELRAALRRMVIEADDERMLRLAQLVERFGVLSDTAGGLKGRLERRRRLLEGYRALREREPEAMAQVLARLDRYQEHLDRLGVRDTHVEEDHLFTRGLAAALRATAVLVLGAPLALLGLLINGLPYGAVLRGVVMHAKTSDVQASSGILVAVVVFPLWYLGLALAGYLTEVPWTVWVPVVAAGPILGLVTMRWRERWRALLAGTVNLWLGLRAPGVRQRLRRMREDLLSRIEELVRASARADRDPVDLA